MDSLKADLSRKDTEVLGLKAQIESLNSQATDKEQLVTMLREQIQAKEQQCAHIQHDVSYQIRLICVVVKGLNCVVLAFDTNTELCDHCLHGLCQKSRCVCV